MTNAISAPIEKRKRPRLRQIAYGIEIINYYADTGEWHPATWFFIPANRKLVSDETRRIKHCREKGDLL